MKIIILEGIATSGKTSVRKELEQLLNYRNLKYSSIDEEETLMPVLNNANPEVSAKYILDVLKKYTLSEVDILIFDRLYLTHIWRTKSTPDLFEKSADILLEHHTSICFLKIPEEMISTRIEHTMSQRDDKWNEYVKTKGSTPEERSQYYSHQQNELLDLLQIIPVSHQIFDTGDKDFTQIAQEIDLLI